MYGGPYGQREEVNGERFRKILCEELQTMVAKAFGTLLYDLLYFEDFENLVKEYAEEMSAAMDETIAAEREKVTTIREAMFRSQDLHLQKRMGCAEVKETIEIFHHAEIAKRQKANDRAALAAVRCLSQKAQDNNA